MHGPTVHGYAQRTPKKMKAAALRGALSDRARGGNVHVLSTLAIDGTPSTKTAMGALKAVSSAKNILVVLSAEDVSGWKSLRNVPEVHLITSGQLNTYDVLVSDDVVFTRAALDEFVAQRQPGRHGRGRLSQSTRRSTRGRPAGTSGGTDEDGAITLTNDDRPAPQEDAK